MKLDVDPLLSDTTINFHKTKLSLFEYIDDYFMTIGQFNFKFKQLLIS